MNRKRWGWTGLVLVLLGSGIAWATWRYSRSPRIDPAIEANLTAIRQQLSPEAAAKLSPEKRNELVTTLRRQVEQLPSEQREQLWQQQREIMHKEMEKRVQDFFALPPSKRTAALDKQIDEMERQHQAWQQMRAQAAKQPPSTGQPSPGGPQANGSHPGGPHTPRPQDHASQIARRVDRLDHSTPEMRAYRQLLMERMKARNITPPFGGPGGRPH